MHDFVCMLLTELAHQVSSICFSADLKNFYPNGKKFVNVRSIFLTAFRLCLISCEDIERLTVLLFAVGFLQLYELTRGATERAGKPMSQKYQGAPILLTNHFIVSVLGEQGRSHSIYDPRAEHCRHSRF